MAVPWWLQDGRIMAGDRFFQCAGAGIRPVIRLGEDALPHLRFLEAHDGSDRADLLRYGHVFRWMPIGKASCTVATEAVYMCIDCGEEMGHTEEYYAHGNLGDIEIIQPATCVSMGQAVRRCQICGEVVKRLSTPAIGQHVPGEWVDVMKPTC